MKNPTLLELKQALFKLNEFCEKNSINYVLTGTLAIHLTGGFKDDPVPHDIDIKTFGLLKSQITLLQDLQNLSYLSAEQPYEDGTCFKIKIYDVEVNILVTSPEKYTKTINEQSIKLCLKDDNGPVTHIIQVQKAYYAIKDKIILCREKDVRYHNNLLRTISNVQYDEL